MYLPRYVPRCLLDSHHHLASFPGCSRNAGPWLAPHTSAPYSPPKACLPAMKSSLEGIQLEVSDSSLRSGIWQAG